MTQINKLVAEEWQAVKAGRAKIALEGLVGDMEAISIA
jgi:hypothetical protein